MTLQIKQQSPSPTFLAPYSILHSRVHLFLHGQLATWPASTTAHPEWPLPAILHRALSLHGLPQEAISTRYQHDLVAATAAVTAAARHGATGPLYPAGACSGHEAAQRYLRRRRARGPRGLLRRPRDEAAAAGRGVQSVRSGGQGEGLHTPGAPVVQAQVLRHPELLTATVRPRRVPKTDRSLLGLQHFYYRAT